MVVGARDNAHECNSGQYDRSGIHREARVLVKTFKHDANTFTVADDTKVVECRRRTIK